MTTINHTLSYLVVLLFASAVAGCTPDYSKSGSEGTPPKEADLDRGVTYDETRLPPKVGQCGKTYSGRATVNQNVFTCGNGNFDFSEFYNRSLASANFQIQNIQCPDSCGPRHDWVATRIWACFDLVKPFRQFAFVEVNAICPKAADAKPKGLPIPTALQLNTAPTLQNYPATGPAIIAETIGDEVPVNCPGVDTSNFEYSKTVKDCNKVDYTPLVSTAEGLARTHHQSLSCKPGCLKSPFKKLHTKWQCEVQPTAAKENIARIEVDYETACRRGGG
ncbi:MAG: hypothetical protein ABJH63_10200 [Rhizobiaceae bacterium]